MIVRIRFRRGPRVSRKKGKNSRIAWLTSSLLTLGSVSCLALGVWRLGVDFGWAGAFVFPDGTIGSHWQVWMAGSLSIQTAAWKLNRYGRPKQEPVRAAAEKEENELSATA